MQSVNELCEKGNSLSEVGMYQEALSCFKHALEKLELFNTIPLSPYSFQNLWLLGIFFDFFP